MQKVKFFKGVESELGTLEEEINGWIEAEGVRVIAVIGNIAPQSSVGTNTFSASDVLVIVTYEAGNG